MKKKCKNEAAIMWPSNCKHNYDSAVEKFSIKRDSTSTIFFPSVYNGEVLELNLVLMTIFYKKVTFVEVQSGGFMIALRLDDCFGAWSAVATLPKESDAEMSDQQSTNSKITQKHNRSFCRKCLHRKSIWMVGQSMTMKK